MTITGIADHNSAAIISQPSHTCQSKSSTIPIGGCSPESSFSAESAIRNTPMISSASAPARKATSTAR